MTGGLVQLDLDLAPAATPLDLSRHAGFRDAALTSAAVLEQLRGAVGFRCWAVTRVTGQTYTVVATGEGGFPARAGEQFRWAQTLCRQVLDGRAPQVAPDVRAVPAYRGLPLVEQWQIGAHLSAPLTLDGVTLYGTVCAVDPRVQPTAVSGAVELIDRQARLLPPCSPPSCAPRTRATVRSGRRLRR